MSRKTENDIVVHATSEGRLYVNADELLLSKRGREMIQEFLASSLYKNIKAKEHKRRR